MGKGFILFFMWLIGFLLILQGGFLLGGFGGFCITLGSVLLLTALLND